MKKLIAGIALAGALVLGVPSVAVASPASYTSAHCSLALNAAEDGRVRAFAREVINLTQAPTTQPVRSDAIRLVRDVNRSAPTSVIRRDARALGADCAAAIQYN